MKRMLSIMVALVLVISLGVTAVADDSTDTGSITITNPVPTVEYELFKIFDASYAVGENGDVALDANGKPVIAYSIDNNNQFFEYLFGENGTNENLYFALTALETKTNSDGSPYIRGEVNRRENTDSIAILNYLQNMARMNQFSPDIQKEASDGTVVFDRLSFGYYLIDKSGATAVTITSVAPDAVVIDKNEKPAQSFTKLLRDDETGNWVPDDSANIGDIVDFKVDFSATNYDGEHKIYYYTVKDTKGSALWVEFDDITVTVGGEKLDRGYYHCVNDQIATNEWNYLGDGWETVTKNPDNAQWYLIHRGFDEFDIVIPWLENHDFTGSSAGFELKYDDANTAKHIYSSPVKVTVEYCASVEPNATIGSATNNTLWNTANLSWTSKHTTGPDDGVTTQLTVYALGLIKEDADSEDRLANAVFELYRDEACTKPVNVIPTNVKGVYILDDLNTIVSGKNRETSREKYKDYLADYLGPNYATTQKNEVTTQANGKLLVIGLEAGDYYLVEKEAPEGYNKLAVKTEVDVGATNKLFFVICDTHGNVVDLQTAPDGYHRHDYTATEVIVKNSRGIELPSTGGEGTMMLITIGTVIALAFAVLLITHKKMSVYHD